MQHGQRGNYKRGPLVTSPISHDKFAEAEGSMHGDRVDSEAAAQGGVMGWVDAAQG